MKLTDIQKDDTQLLHLIFKNMTEGVWILDLDFHIVYANPAVLIRRGLTFDELKRMSLADQLTPASLEAINKVISQELTPEKLSEKDRLISRTLEMEFLQKNGNTYWMEATITLLRDENGKPEGYLGVSRDIGSKKKIEAELIESEKRYRSLFEGFPLGLYQTTPEGKIVNVNHALVKLLRYPDHESLLQLKSNELFVQPSKRIDQLSSLYSSDILLQSEIEIRCYDGTTIWVRDNAHAVRDSHGQIIYFEGSLEDITNIRIAEKALREGEERYRNLVENMGEGLTIVDEQEYILFSNPAADIMFGVGFGKLIGRNLKEFLDQDQMTQVLKQTYRRKKGEKSQYEIVISRPDGENRNLLVTATPQYDAQGKFISSFGVIHDITIRRQNELTLEQTRSQLANQVQELASRTREISTLSDMVNMLQKCTAVNETFEVIAAYTQQLFPGANGAFYFKKDTGKFKLVEKWGVHLHSSSEMKPEDCWGIRREKIYAISESTFSPICAHIGKSAPGSSICVPVSIDKEITGLLHLETAPGMFNLSEDQQRLATALCEQISLALSNVRLKEELHEQAIRDSLTGLFNRYYMEESLVKELSRAHRSGKNIGLIMLDLDRFKELNTIYGHPKADEILRDFGTLLNGSIRASDIACRYGGDEFLIIMPETTSDTLTARADQLRQKVKDFSKNNNLLKDFGLTASIGIASFPTHGQTPAELLKAADDALMEAKKKHDTIIIAQVVNDNLAISTIKPR